MKVQFRKGHVYKQIEQGFVKNTDPWNFMNSSYEKLRMDKMLKLVQRVPHKSILEIGCAEGHFTKMLTTISKDVTAIDVSPTAIKRAKKNAPDAKYVMISFEDFVLPQRHYDIILFCETLYYLENIPFALQKIKKLGSYLLTSNFLTMFWPGWKVEYYLFRMLGKPIESKLHLSMNESRKMSLLALRQLRHG